MASFKSPETGIENITITSNYIEIVGNKELLRIGGLYLESKDMLLRLEKVQGILLSKPGKASINGKEVEIMTITLTRKHMQHNNPIVSMAFKPDMAQQVYNEIKRKMFKIVDTEFEDLKSKVDELTAELEVQKAMIKSLTERQVESPTGNLLDM